MARLDQLQTFVSDVAFHVVVESPRGSSLKLKYDPELEAMSISRPLATGLVYPFDWGFVPSTQAEDGDPVDAMLYWDVTTFPGVVVPCRALGAIQVEQNRADGTGRARNDRLLALPLSSRRERDVTSVMALPKRLRDELEHFFVATTFLEGKDPKILGWTGPDDALAHLRRMTRRQ